MPHLMSLLAAFVAVSVGMGVLAAGLFIPGVAALGAASNSTIAAFEKPESFQTTELSQQSVIVDANNKTIATPYDQNRILVKLKKVAPIMRQAQIAIEDSRFYEHGGIDIRGTGRAFFSNVTSGSSQGGSSLTQQYVKMTLQEAALQAGDEQAALDAIDKNYARKIREMKLALVVEETMTKNQILEGYLNLAYYGDQAYGIEAAARHYFGVHASELDLSQAATLAGVVQQPSTTDPHNYPEVAERRRNVVLDRMAQLGVVTQAQAEQAKRPTVKSMLRIRENAGGTCARSSQPFFCNYVMDYLKRLPQLGANVDERMLAVNRGGLRIKTTLRSDWQATIFKQLTAVVPSGDPSGVGAAAAVVEPGTGKLLAMVQTSVFNVSSKVPTLANGQPDPQFLLGKTQQSWVSPIDYGGTLGFAIGSTAKVGTLVTALEAGWPVNGTVPSKKAGPGLAASAEYLPSEYHDECGSARVWNVSNDFTEGGGVMTFRHAVAGSVNTAFASSAIALGGCKVRATMTRLGMRQGNGDPITENISDIVLGSASVPPLTMANTYATLAAEGKHCDINPIESITYPDGKKVKLPKTKCKQVVEPDIARGATALLQGVITGGTGTGAQIGRPAAGKTGTHTGHQQSWFVGYTPQYATAVYVGTPTKARDMDNILIGGRRYPQVFGGTIAAPLWGTIMRSILADQPVEYFNPPSYLVLNGVQVSIPSVIGRSVAEATAILQASGFQAAVIGNISSTIPFGLVAGMQPSGTAARGTTIGLQLSTGFVPPPPSTSSSTSSSTSTSSPSTPPSSTTTKPGNTNTKPPKPPTGTGTPRP